ncbi:MAG TPA: UDP-N-acetylmuramoyl-L-alanyl-D-glutamate--2,6-diaminopimelate ligase, partial [Myxococcota bacterium]|nr:UDP-N-acetylmuramoyl-L-alanyl-D-glutamate--2,6-diaminopimelate ligase [Myxococcota bacterium]
REALSYLCEGFYGWPSRGLKIIGITGTNGKTSTTFMLHSILKHAGLKAHVMGTLGFGEPGALSPLRHTTTEPEVLSACLSQQRKAGISHIAMEVSSHALAQKRVAAIHFAAVAFSNLTHEHLDFHQTMDNYRRAKESLFKLAHKEALKILPRDHPLDRAIDELPGIYLFDPNESLPVGLPLFGDFQKKNALLALHIAKALGIDDQSIALGLQSCPKIPGRLEPVFMTGPIVLVDFAHTPDALRNVLQALKLKKRGKLIVVFGCGGDRDQQKRPLMGNVVGELADRIYVTDDNPRNEDPKWIRAAILAGIKKTCDVYEIADRKCAIHAAIKSAAHEDVVLIAG